jgi:hypothetical protein
MPALGNTPRQFYLAYCHPREPGLRCGRGSTLSNETTLPFLAGHPYRLSLGRAIAPGRLWKATHLVRRPPPSARSAFCNHLVDRQQFPGRGIQRVSRSAIRRHPKINRAARSRNAVHRPHRRGRPHLRVLRHFGRFQGIGKQTIRENHSDCSDGRGVFDQVIAWLRFADCPKHHLSLGPMAPRGEDTLN